MSRHWTESVRAANAVMAGRSDALRRFDFSAEGFWNSFLSILIATPALSLGWLAAARRSVAEGVALSLPNLMARYAAVDLASWIVPLVLLGIIIRFTPIADRFIAYVVATNWAGVSLLWLVTPAVMVQLALPPLEPSGSLLAFLVFIAAMVFYWRLTNAVLGHGPLMATAVFLGTYVAGILVANGMQVVLGV